ncbi:evasin P467-like [Dermacentor andersoni]|uniref:evasin P467-like n=1 Tax=Dermacentor andersoni TaxID=34620 RepID=UPI002415A3C0|nr:evasin P467-like [Dermacentor andersoni]
MNTFIYAVAISFALWVACEPEAGDTTEDDSDYGSVGCPFLVAVNKSGFGTTVECNHTCNNGTEIAPNGVPCLTIGKDGLERMQPYFAYACPLGECQNGTCVANGMNETCYKSVWQQ